MKKLLSFALTTLIMLSGCENSSKAEVKKQKVGDIELAYYSHGKGDPIVLITGFKGTMSMWDPAFIAELAKNYKVIAFDNRGVGSSTDTPENRTTIQQMADDAVGLIQALGYKKVNLLGWSMGTSIAIQAALDHPEMFNTLILCAPNAGGPNHTVNKEVYAKLTSPSSKPSDLFAIMFPDTPEGKKAAEEYKKRVGDALANGYLPKDEAISKETIERQSSALKLRGSDNHLYDKLPTIKIPTLVAGGMQDVVDLPSNVQAIANRIPYAWSAYFPDSGHAFTSQDFGEFSRLIDVFLRSEQR